MKDNEFKKLVEKYKEGDSTLKEENSLFNNAGKSEPSLEAWSTFVNINKTETPQDFNDKLWKSFQNKKARKRRRIISVLSAAASILILVSIFIANRGPKEQSYAEKERLLNQALSMFDDFEEKKVEHNVFYENEMIVVYTITE